MYFLGPDPKALQEIYRWYSKGFRQKVEEREREKVELLRAPRIRNSFSAGKMLFANLRVRLMISNASEYLLKVANALHNYEDDIKPNNK